MIRRLAEYTVRQDELETVLEAVRTFVAAVRKHEPRTTYDAYRRGTSPSFVHVMAFPDQASERRHQRAQHTERFVEVLYPRCTDPPTFTELTAVAGSASG